MPDADLDVVLVQQPHHRRLAVAGGDDADAEIQFFFAHRDLDPAVLGAPSFGDVQLGENLDAGGDGAQQAAGRAIAFDQHAVDPVADADAILERLDVDVRSPQLNGFLDQQLHQPDDGGAVLVDRLAAR